jgi:hypothetical protein
MGKWELFRYEKDIAIKKFVAAKRRVLGFNKLMKQIRLKKVINILWRRYKKAHYLFINRIKYKWASAVLAKRFAKVQKRIYGFDSYDDRN